MRRRELLAALALGALGGALAAPASAHTPYRQWQVYRRKHLLIGCHREDPAGYALVKAMIARLDEHLPDARARPARGPDARRLASLLGTAQLDVALLEDADAVETSAGTGRFAPYGAIALRALLRLPGRVLVAREDFPERHARLVVDALAGFAAGEAAAAPNGDGEDIDALPVPLAWHLGAARHRRGQPPSSDAP